MIPVDHNSTSETSQRLNERRFAGIRLAARLFIFAVRLALAALFLRFFAAGLRPPAARDFADLALLALALLGLPLVGFLGLMLAA
jgi:hypothetical protein